MRKGFAQLFAGRPDLFGVYRVSDAGEGEKRKGTAETVKHTVTDEVFARHLRGEIRLGIVPIRPDGTVGWFALDVDEYPIDHKALNQKCREKDLPLVVCRSKSGGAHLYCFIRGKRTVPAHLAIAVAERWRSALGYPRAEIFPKQQTLNEGAVGNWINLPYHGGDSTTDTWAFDGSGNPLRTVESFEAMADAYAALPEELERAAKASDSKKSTRDPLSDAPPCVERMYGDKVSSGGRHLALMQIAIYLRMSDPDSWREKVEQANDEVMDPPLEYSEVHKIIGDVSKGKLQYLCRQEPMCSLCDKVECKERTWGIGPKRGIIFPELEVQRVRKVMTDPPSYYVTVFDVEVRLSNNDFMNAFKFWQKVLDYTHVMIKPMKAPAYLKLMQKMVEMMEVMEVQSDMTDIGEIIEIFWEWVSREIISVESIDKVALGHAFLERETNTVIFRGRDVLDLIRNKRLQVGRSDVYDALSKIGGVNKQRRINGRPTWVYEVRAPDNILEQAEKEGTW